MRPLPGCFLFVLCLGFGPTVQRDCGCVGKFRTIVAAVAGFCLCCVWGDFVGWVGKFRTIVAAVAGFCLCCVWGDGAVWGDVSARLCGCVGKFHTIVAAIA